MHSEHLGWILTCPSNLGTGLRAGSMVKVISPKELINTERLNYTLGSTFLRSKGFQGRLQKDGTPSSRNKRYFFGSKSSNHTYKVLTAPHLVERGTFPTLTDLASLKSSS